MPKPPLPTVLCTSKWEISTTGERRKKTGSVLVNIHEYDLVRRSGHEAEQGEEADSLASTDGKLRGGVFLSPFYTAKKHEMMFKMEKQLEGNYLYLSGD